MGKEILSLHILLGALILCYGTTINSTESSTSVVTSVTTVSKRVIAKSLRKVNNTILGNNSTVETPPVTEKIPVSFPNLEKIETFETHFTEETGEIVKPQKLKKKILASNLKNVNDKILPNDKAERNNVLKPIITTTDKIFFKNDNLENALNSTKIMKEILLKRENEDNFSIQEKNQTLIDFEILKNVESSNPRTIEARSFEESISNGNEERNLKKIMKSSSMIMERTTNVYLDEYSGKLETTNNSQRYNETGFVVNRTLSTGILPGKKITLISKDNIKKNFISFNKDFNRPNETEWVPIVFDHREIKPLNDAQSFGNKRLNRTIEKQTVVSRLNEQNFQTQTETNVIPFQEANTKKTIIRHKNNIEKPLMSASDEAKIFNTQTQTGRVSNKFRGAVKYKFNQSQNYSKEDKIFPNETILKEGNFSLENVDVNLPVPGGSLITPTLESILSTKVTSKLPETTEISVAVVMTSANTTKKLPNLIDDSLVIPPEHMKFKNVSKNQKMLVTNNIVKAENRDLTPVSNNASESINSQINVETTISIMKNSDSMNLTEVFFPRSVGKSNKNKTSPDLQFPKVMANEVETTSVDLTNEGLVTSESSLSTSEFYIPQVNTTYTTEKLKQLDVSSQNITISNSTTEKIMEIPGDNFTKSNFIHSTSMPLGKVVLMLTTSKPNVVKKTDEEDGHSIEIKPTTTIETTMKKIDEMKKFFNNISSPSPLPILTTSDKTFRDLNETIFKKTSTTISKSFKTLTKQISTTPLSILKSENSTKNNFFAVNSTVSKKDTSTFKIDNETMSTISNATVNKAITEIPPTNLFKTTIGPTKKNNFTTLTTTFTTSNFTFKKSTITATSSSSTTSHNIPTIRSTTSKLTTTSFVPLKTLTSTTIATKKSSSSNDDTEFTTNATPTTTSNSNRNIIYTSKSQEGIYYKDYIPSTINPHFEITEENVPAYLRLTVEAVSWAELCSLKEDLHDAIIRMLGGNSNVSSESVHFLNLNDKNCQDKIDKMKNQDTNQTIFLPVNMFLMDKKGDFDKNLSEVFLTFWGHQGLDFELPIRKVDFVTPIVNLTELTEPPLGGSVVAAIVISCVAGLCVIFLGVLFVIMKRRQKRFNYGQRCTPVSLDAYSLDSVSIYNSVRRKGMRASKRSYGNAAFDDPEVPTHPMNFAGLANFSADKEHLYEEFNVIPQINPKVEELPEGAETKNRYANVIPLPETRVHLSKKDGDPLSEYINANYIRGPKGTEKLYIACQAPMESTIQDFWRMIWEEQCKVILMITNLEENGIEKCADYLPPNEVTDSLRLFGDFQITLKKRDVKEKYIISHLKLKNMEANLWREAVHLWYLGWPDQGVPSETSSIIAFLIEARSQMKVQNGSTTSSPTVVHCSPGTGRTGTVIACDLCIREYEQSRLVDIPKCVYNLRRDRAGSVQTKDQYAFIYQVLNFYATKLSGGGIESI